MQTFLKKHGLSTYYVLLALVVLLSPRNSAYINDHCHFIIAWLPAADRYFDLSDFPTKTLLFQIASVLFSPLVFFYLNERLVPGYRSIFKQKGLLGPLVTILLVDAYIAWLFSQGSYGLSGRPAGFAIGFSKLLIYLALVGPLLSIGLIFIIFFTIAFLCALRHDSDDA